MREARGSKTRRRLTVDEQGMIVDTLMAIRIDKEAPTWGDIADVLDTEPHLLVHYEPDQFLGARAPVMRSLVMMNSLSPKTHPVLQWWRDASQRERADFMTWLADPAVSDDEERLESQFSPMLEALSDKERESLFKLRFPSGRSAHSRPALKAMNAEMRTSGDTYVTVRNRLFNASEDMRPKGASLDTQSDHPTLQRILPAVRRFLHGVERETGSAPDNIVVEHVRESLMGLTARREAAAVQRRNQRDREQAAADVRAAGLGIENPSTSDIKKFQAIRRQGSACLYCGDALVFGATELDHIVPRSTGGNSTRANLVAVCRDCNARKGKQTFQAFARADQRPGVSLEDALTRVTAMERFDLDARAFWRLKREMSRRLRQTELDDPVDERSLASTAYAAVDMVRRINESYDDPNLTRVYRGQIVNAARKASGIDERIAMRPGLTSKSRFDRRHHAIDAAVAALLNPSVARTLAEREDLRRAALDTGEENGWKTYEGSGPTAVERFRTWKTAMRRLAELISAALERDEVVVMQSVRFSGRHGALHQDERVPHLRKKVGDSWSMAERALIVDDLVYEAISGPALPSSDISADPTRTVLLPSGKRLTAEDDVFIFPDKKARIALPRHSSAALGATLHHVRLYRWRTPKGLWTADVVRVFARDLYDLVGTRGPNGQLRGDLITAPLIPSSKACRRSAKNLRDALHEGRAELVGALLPGDEILIDPSEWANEKTLAPILEQWPERHWQFIGAEEGKWHIRPLLLSREGITTDEVASDRRLVAVSPSAAKVIGERARPTMSALWKYPGTRVVRRSSLGRIRENSSGLPSTWNPYDAVHRM